MKSCRIYFIGFLFLVMGCATSGPITTEARNSAILKAEAKPETELIQIDHGAYQIFFAPKFRLPQYVRYSLSAENLRKGFVKRKGSEKFPLDPKLIALDKPQAHEKEYKRTGYDRGHMAPAADFAWSETASEATYYISNIAPQKPNLNRKAWRYLEDRVRRYACGEGLVSVIAGPILEENLPALKSGLPIPQSFFKIVVDETPPQKVLAFIYSQDDEKDVYKERQVDLAEVQSRTGINLSDLISPVPVRSPSSLEDWKEENCKAKR